MATTNGTFMNWKEVVALRGLRLPSVVLNKVTEARIYCTPAISVEHQRTAERHVLAAQESGGAVAEFGVYCGFASEDGNTLPWLQRRDNLAPNGIHARVIGTGFLRLHILRVLHTYDLLVTRHLLESQEGKSEPVLKSSIVFWGSKGTLDLELWDKDRRKCGTVLPQFFDRSGEPLSLPESLHDITHRAVMGVTCVGCRHVHLLVPPERTSGLVEEGSRETANQ
jgi:hypothetical protein